MRPIFPLLFVLAACGDDGAAPIADAPPSSLPDSQDPPVPKLVSLTITSGDDPVPGVTVYFQNADSSLVAKLDTNANGVAEVEMEAGGFVTAIEPFASIAPSDVGDLRTIAGVQPGDQLQLHQDAEWIPTTIGVEILYPQFTGGTFYRLFTTCSSSQHDLVASRDVTLTDCGATAHVLVEVRDRFGVSLGWFHRADVALTDGMTLDLSAEVYLPPFSTTYTYANAPQGLSEVSIGTMVLTPRGFLHSASGRVPAMPGSTTLARPTPTGAPAVTVSIFEGTSPNMHSLIDWGPASSIYAIDLGTTLLPAYTSAPGFEVTAHAVGWTVAPGPSPAPELSYAIVDLADDAASRSWTWQIISPYTAPIVELPTLPGDGAIWNATAQLNINVRNVLTAIAPGGYDAARPIVFGTGLEALIAGTSGRIVVEQVAPR